MSIYGRSALLAMMMAASMGDVSFGMRMRMPRAPRDERKGPVTEDDLERMRKAQEKRDRRSAKRAKERKT